MKFILTLFLFLPLGSLGFLRDCLKSQEEKKKEKTQKKAERLARIKRLNHLGQTNMVVSLKTKDELYSTYTFPTAWPEIRKTVAYDEQDLMEWTLHIKDNANYIEIIGPHLTSTPSWKHINMDHTWAIKPLALGTTTLVARYQSKGGEEITDEITYTVTVVD